MFEPTILTLCTGNAARSPIAEVMLKAGLPVANIHSAGTHVVEGQPVSWRTRLGLEVVRRDLSMKLNSHRSHQVNRNDVAGADLVLCMAGEHVAYMRREFPEFSGKVGSLHRMARDLPVGHLASLRDRIAEMDLASKAIESWEDIVDPAGGDVEDFARCAQTLDGLVSALVVRIVMMRL